VIVVIGVPTIAVLATGRCPAPTRVARLLGIPEGAAVVYCERVHAVNGQPVAVAHHYLPVALGEHLRAADLTEPTLGRVLQRKLGLTLRMIQQGVAVAMADAAIATRLGVGLLAPVLYRESAVYAQAGHAVQVVEIYFRSDRDRPPAELPLRARRCKRRMRMVRLAA
jgi:GntR family transcriptional regulator